MLTLIGMFGLLGLAMFMCVMTAEFIAFVTVKPNQKR
jgi:hypothetical protein